MRIVTWNVNSISSRLQLLESFIQAEQPEVLLLQELKCIEERFPHDLADRYGYNTAIYGQPTYNGVAIMSKYRLSEISKINFAVPEARYVEATVESDPCVRIGSIYVPNGTDISSDRFQNKLLFLDNLRTHLNGLLQSEERVVIGGDFNVAPYPEDVHDPERMDGCIDFHPAERSRFRAICRDGYYDALRLQHPTGHAFTWWDYRHRGSLKYDKGMRIDHILLSPRVAEMWRASKVHRDFRAAEKPSDHAPVSITLSI